MANRATGKGYENEDNYTNIHFQFIGIENIHVMRNSQQKLIEGTCTSHLFAVNNVTYILRAIIYCMNQNDTITIVFFILFFHISHRFFKEHMFVL